LFFVTGQENWLLPKCLETVEGQNSGILQSKESKPENELDEPIIAARAMLLTPSESSQKMQHGLVRLPRKSQQAAAAPR